ncbi:DnaD domain protein [Bacillus sp. JJ1533]|uniref:DnaD domain-containing protein n=1 Tax=Bacillus sp. JJ1533 TaxID=3122959 RepID=UPI002FFFD7A5
MADKINAWCTDLSDELVIKAMKLAIENSSKRWSYVEAILRDWVDKGYQTSEDVQAARLAYKNQMNHPSMKKQTRQEIIPDWFHKSVHSNEPDTAYKKDKRVITTATQEPAHASSFEEKKRLFEERMKKYRDDDYSPCLHTTEKDTL